MVFCTEESRHSNKTCLFWASNVDNIGVKEGKRLSDRKKKSCRVKCRVRLFMHHPGTIFLKA